MMSDAEQVGSVLQAFTAGWKSLDGEAVGETLERSPATTVIGTDPGEYIVGHDAYLAGWQSGRYPIAIAVFDWEQEPVIVVQGAGAWAHGIVRYDMVVEVGQRVTGRMWISTALRKREEWRITHLHASYADVPSRSSISPSR